MNDRAELRRALLETAEEEPAFDLFDFLITAKGFAEYVEQLEGVMSEDNRLFFEVWSGLSTFIELLTEITDE